MTSKNMNISRAVMMCATILLVIFDPKKWTMREPKEFDTIVVPAQEAGFQNEFLCNKQWYALRIGVQNVKKIKYIAAYRVKPVSAITHYAEIDTINEYRGEHNTYNIKRRSGGIKYIARFKSEPLEIKPVRLGEALPPQGPRYTSLDKLLNAKTLLDL
jgi:hypothetical protein